MSENLVLELQFLSLSPPATDFQSLYVNSEFCASCHTRWRRAALESVWLFSCPIQSLMKAFSGKLN